MPRKTDENVEEYTLELVNTSSGAILVKNDRGKEVWIPRSMLIEFIDNDDGTCTVEMTEWAATEKEIA